MSTSTWRTKVLIIEEEVGVRKVIQTLLASMGYEPIAVSRGHEALALLREKNFDAVLLDRRCFDPPAEKVIDTIEEIRPELLERILIIAEDGGGVRSAEFIESHSLPSVARTRLLQEICPSLEALFQPSPLIPPIVHKARLVFHSFHHPVEAGLRASRTLTRQLVYEHGSVSVDMRVESEPASNRIWLVGQIGDSAKPNHKIENLPVVVAGRKGSLAQATTNRFGEFLLDFWFEDNAQLTIGISDRHVILIPLQDLEAMRGRQSGAKSNDPGLEREPSGI